MSQYFVLCVDDDAAIRQMYADAFGAWGHRAITAASGEQALDLLGRLDTQVDAILLDYEMPAMNGFELAAEIQRSKPNLPIIMVSGNAEIMRHNSRFVDVALSKGCELGVLMSQIENLVAQRRNPKPSQPIRWTIAGAASA